MTGERHRTITTVRRAAEDQGVGEAGTIASTPAVVNAVVDALRPYGVHDVAMPCTPERVWRAINEGSPGGETTEAAMPHFDETEGGVQ